jgi:hypothetical protein
MPVINCYDGEEHWCTKNARGEPMADKLAHIDRILQIMQDCWDLPADCNQGELFTYAEALFDKIDAGESRHALYQYLANVQKNILEMPESEAYRDIIDRSSALVSNPN